MAYYNNYSYNGDSYSAIRLADGKVLGRVKHGVKSATPQAGMKDYRFFVYPVSPLPRGYEEAERIGFTGFMSRIGYGFNSFQSEEEAEKVLEEDVGNMFISFTPALRNNKYYVLDDMVREGRTPFMNVDHGFLPVPAFGTADHPVFDGDINKFCQHLAEGKPLPGLSKRYWNNDISPRIVIAATRNFEDKIGPWVVFAPLHGEAFDGHIIGEGGAYFRVKNGPLGYGLVDDKNSNLLSHIVRCKESPLWFIPEEFIPDLTMNMKPVPSDGDILKDVGVKYNPFALLEEEEPVHLGHSYGDRISDDDITPIADSLSSHASHETEAAAPEEKKEEKKELTEADFIARLHEAAEKTGLLYDKQDLINFHISVKSSRLVILAGMSGTGKSGLVRLYGRALGLPEERVRFLPVRPSWMDDGDILGYVDMKNMVYRSADTGLAELLADAASHPEQLYMVCFDEMNLARAEHYFAQFISVLEKDDDPVIRLYNPALAPRLYNAKDYPAEIPVGRNVIFTGTVNVDESTYHFSDKILDRANVITLHQGRFHDLLSLPEKEDVSYEEIGSAQFDSFRKSDGLGLTARELDLLDGLNDAFHDGGSQSGIGFRIACQMGRYLINIPEGLPFDRKAGLDAQVVQRILTKLRGSAEQLAGLVSLDDKGELTGSIDKVLRQFADLSSFTESEKVLKAKARELKLYDYTL